MERGELIRLVKEEVKKKKGKKEMVENKRARKRKTWCEWSDAMNFVLPVMM